MLWLLLARLSFSSLVTKINDLRGNPGLPLPALLAKEFSCCVSYCLIEVGDHGVQISIFNLLPAWQEVQVAWKLSTHHYWIIQLLEVLAGGNRVLYKFTSLLIKKVSQMKHEIHSEWEWDKKRQSGKKTTWKNVLSRKIWGRQHNQIS